MRIFRFFLLIFGLFLVSGSVYATVETFSYYDTTLKVHSNNTIDVKKHLKLKNVYEVGIVPGQIEFKIGRGTQGSIEDVEVANVVAYDSFGNEIKTHLRKIKDYSVIILEIYYPLLPGFEYEFVLEYSLTYKPGGIFFKSLKIPLRESTIPIESGNFNVELPDHYYFTYLSDSDNVTVEDGVAVWDIKKDLPESVSFEYSWIPVKVFDFKGSYVFWILVNMLLLLILVFEVRREIKRVSEAEE